MKAIEIENLAKVYRRGFWGTRFTALSGLSLSVEEGEIYGFIGANGAGKTTTFKILMGIAKPTSGSARILGTDISARGARMKAGYLPEESYYYNYLTARELLRFYGRLQGMRGRDVAARSGAILESVGLAESADARLGEFSKGMRQRFGIAQALVNDPAVLFLDEPLTGLDPPGRKGLRDLILDLKRRGKTVFFSSHILSDAEAICDRIAVLDRGGLVAEGPIGKLLGSKVKSYELQISGAQPDAVKDLGIGVGIRSDAGIVHVTLDGTADPDAVIDRVRSAGGKVVALIPVRETLEEFFMRSGPSGAHGGLGGFGGGA